MSNFPIVLGITYGGHDSSACLTVGGKLIAACEEERFNRKKHTQEFPKLSINECLNKAEISEKEILEKIKERNEARDNKNYKHADKIRDELLHKGISIEDKDGKTTWKFK